MGIFAIFSCLRLIFRILNNVTQHKLLIGMSHAAFGLFIMSHLQKTKNNSYLCPIIITKIFTAL